MATIVGNIWDLRGTVAQNRLVTQAIQASDFPWSRLVPSLQNEGKTKIIVAWRDLSRYYQVLAAQEAAGGHDHLHEDGATAHPLVRKLNGRSRVLGLFYLPPHTMIVLDRTLQYYPSLAKEVFLAEAAHAVDYHFMTNEHRRAFWNLIHNDAGDLPEGTVVHDSGNIHHNHSWFDGFMGYNTWIGESWMEGFVRSFAPTIPVTLKLGHPIPSETRTQMRNVLIGEERAAVTPTASANSAGKPVFAPRGSKVFHVEHAGIAQGVRWPSAEAAIADGKRPCGYCA